jgi:hypothetical protein
MAEPLCIIVVVVSIDYAALVLPGSEMTKVLGMIAL